MKSSKSNKSNVDDISRETQRLISGSHVRLPYHIPKQKPLKDFLNKRKITTEYQVSITGSKKLVRKSWEFIKTKEQNVEKFYNEDCSENEDDEELPSSIDDVKAKNNGSLKSDNENGSNQDLSDDGENDDEEEDSRSIASCSNNSLTEQNKSKSDEYISNRNNIKYNMDCKDESTDNEAKLFIDDLAEVSESDNSSEDEEREFIETKEQNDEDLPSSIDDVKAKNNGSLNSNNENGSNQDLSDDGENDDEEEDSRSIASCSNNSLTEQNKSKSVVYISNRNNIKDNMDCKDESTDNEAKLFIDDLAEVSESDNSSEDEEREFIETKEQNDEDLPSSIDDVKAKNNGSLNSNNENGSIQDLSDDGENDDEEEDSRSIASCSNNSLTEQNKSKSVEYISNCNNIKYNMDCKDESTDNEAKLFIDDLAEVSESDNSSEDEEKEFIETKEQNDEDLPSSIDDVKAKNNGSLNSNNENGSIQDLSDDEENDDEEEDSRSIASCSNNSLTEQNKSKSVEYISNRNNIKDYMDCEDESTDNEAKLFIDDLAEVSESDNSSEDEEREFIETKEQNVEKFYNEDCSENEDDEELPSSIDDVEAKNNGSLKSDNENGSNQDLSDDEENDDEEEDSRSISSCSNNSLTEQNKSIKDNMDCEDESTDNEFIDDLAEVSESDNSSEDKERVPNVIVISDSDEDEFSKKRVRRLVLSESSDEDSILEIDLTMDDLIPISEEPETKICTQQLMGQCSGQFQSQQSVEQEDDDNIEDDFDSEVPQNDADSTVNKDYDDDEEHMVGAIDKLEEEEGDKDKLDENDVKDGLDKMYMRQLLDDDQQQVTALKEMLLEDGELHTDSGRKRKFQWEDQEDAAFKKPLFSEDKDEVLSDDDSKAEQWRKDRFKRESYLSLKNNSDDEEQINEDEGSKSIVTSSVSVVTKTHVVKYQKDQSKIMCDTISLENTDEALKLNDDNNSLTSIDTIDATIISDNAIIELQVPNVIASKNVDKEENVCLPKSKTSVQSSEQLQIKNHESVKSILKELE